MRVCYAEQMRRADRRAMEEFDIPSIVLMENAANSCLREIENFEHVAVICGKGNNGGDGLAIARKLIIMGKDVKIYLVLGTDFVGDALTNYRILENMGVAMNSADNLPELKYDIQAADCVVDAIFGTGFKGTVSGNAAEVIQTINDYAKFVLSVDVPSGINADSGEAEIAVIADKTVTFGAYKTGMLLYPAAEFTGKVTVADISLPDEVFKSSEPDIRIADSKLIEKILPRRYANSHKGDYGKIFVIGGNKTMPGAVCMACNAVLKSGAGTVTACVPEEIAEIIHINSVPSMTYPVRFERDIDDVIEKAKEYDVVLFGCGIGREDYVLSLLKGILSSVNVPIVVDADGLYALSKNLDMLKNAKAEIILTPHSAEMARLIGKDVNYVEQNRFSVSRDFSKRYGVTLVLKGNHSIITSPQGEQYVNITGNSGMATAGSGDVLAGMTAALAHNAEKPEYAACAAVYLHAAAGDFAAKRLCETSVTATDIIESVFQAFPVEK